MTTLTTPLDLNRLHEELGGGEAPEIIDWAARTFGDGLAMSSSFGAQAAVMLHLVTRRVPRIPVILIDTGYLFPETYRFADELQKRLDLNLHVFQSPVSPARMEALHGRLWEQGLEGLNRYDQMRKVEPMQRALAELGVTAWLSGIRAGQTRNRASLRIVEATAERTDSSNRAAYKIHPILNWTSRGIHEYLKEHDLPYHPLFDLGYVSIGDVHSTRPVVAGEDERAGRFGGLKSECGLHLPQTPEENQSLGASGL
ncbi:MAG: phosphoadenylyl-sulfate reductase [Phycisphaeraceae bacterium]|nr:phosphoadenylyl-sulfate reductase [Phycisphaeraceae bacterium]